MQKSALNMQHRRPTIQSTPKVWLAGWHGCDMWTSKLSAFCLRHHHHLSIVLLVVFNCCCCFFLLLPLLLLLLLLLRFSSLLSFVLPSIIFSLFLLARFFITLRYTEFHTLWIMLKILYSWRGNFSKTYRVCVVGLECVQCANCIVLCCAYIPMCLFMQLLQLLLPFFTGILCNCRFEKLHKIEKSGTLKILTWNERTTTTHSNNNNNNTNHFNRINSMHTNST